MEVCLNVDWWSNNLLCREKEDALYSAERVHRDVASWAEAGVTTVFWRVTGVGRVAHQSKVEWMPTEDEKATLPTSIKPAVETLKVYDPLEVGIEACRKNGMKIYAWVDMFDEYWLGSQGRFTTENPECQFVDRSGLIYFKGVPCYAYPQTREFKLKHIAEVSEYQPDGVYLSCRAHGNHWNQFQQIGMFGYNEPVVNEYERRTGVNLCDVKNISPLGWPIDKIVYDGPAEDKELLYTIQGEFQTEYYRQVKEVLKSKSQQLIVDVGMGEYDGVMPGFAPFKYEHEKWFEESIVDRIVMVLNLQGGWANEEYYNANDFLSMAWKYRKHEASSVLAWINVNPKTHGRLEGIRKLVGTLSQCHASTLLDGYTFHEAATLQRGFR